MPNFFIIDHSLEHSGGHHAVYAKLVAGAAREMGFETTIGANAKLKPIALAGCGARVLSAFRDSTYQPFSYLAGLRTMKRAGNRTETRSSRQVPGVVDSLGVFDSASRRDFGGRSANRNNKRFRILDRLRTLRSESRRTRFIRKFAADCRRFFQPAIFTESDHIFFTTVSELELMGLAAWLASEPRTIQAHWHLQFHFSLFDGRPPEYSAQRETLIAVRACFDAALSRIPSHAVHFYTTSQTLADQYNCLKTGHFDCLPYPIAPSFFTALSDQNKARANEKIIQFQSGSSGESESETPNESRDQIFKNVFSEQSGAAGDKQEPDRDTQQDTDNADSGAVFSRDDLEQVLSFDQPLKIAVPGAIRREKGQQRALQPLVDKIWESHLVTGNAQLFVQRPVRNWPVRQKLELDLPAQISVSADPVSYVSHPLPEEDYSRFITSSDCGLLMYDDRVYFSRRAGVMCEMLSSGKPVIVPAGTWLADQIQEPSARHIKKMVSGENTARQLGLDSFRWNGKNVPLSGGVISFDRDRHPFNFAFDIESGETGFAIAFDWHWPDSHGTYARIEISQRDSAGKLIQENCRVVGRSRRTGDSSAFFRLDQDTATVHVMLRNAFHDSNVSVKNPEINTICSSEVLPVGAVGIIAADDEDYVSCVDEMVDHYEHYSDTARQFASSWQRMHDPRRTIAGLISRERFQARVA